MNRNREIKVLLIEEDPTVARRVKAVLSRSAERCFTLQHVSTLSEGLERLAAHSADVALLGLDSGAVEKSLQALERARDAAPEVPIIVLAESLDEEFVIKAARHRAQDCLENKKNPAGGYWYPGLLQSLHFAVERRRMDEKLKQEAYEWSSAFDSMVDYISIHDTQYRILKVNRALARRLGLPADELVGRLCYEVMHGMSEPWPACPHQKTIETGESITCEVNDPHFGADLLVTTSPIFNESGELAGTVHVARDISELKQAEARLFRHAAIVNGRKDIFRKALNCTGEEELAAACLSVPQDLTGSSFGFLGEVNDRGRLDTITLSDPGWEACRMPDQIEAARLLKDMEMGSFWGRVIREGRTVIVNDPRTDPDSVGTPAGHPPITSFIGVPLKRAEETVGLIGLANKPGGYNEADAEIAEALAGTIMEAIDHRREAAEILRLKNLHEEIVDHSPVGIIRLDQDLKVTYENPRMKEIMGVPAGEASVAEGMDIRVLPSVTRAGLVDEFNRLTLGREIKGEMPFESVYGVESYISYHGIPLLEQGEFCGGLLLVEDITGRRLAELKIKQKAAELEAANLDLSTLYRVSSMVSQSIQLDKLFSHALEAIFGLQLFDVQKKGGIFTVEGDRLRLAAQRGASKVFLDLHCDLKLGDCLCGLVAANGEAIISTNCHHDERHTISYPGMTPHGHVVIPLKAGAEVVGVLYTYTPAGFKISQKQLQLLESVCGQLAVAIQHSRLFEEARTLALHDPLTGLANRKLMDVELNKGIARFKRTAKPFSVIMLDLDHFKDYNDTYGHIAGDRLLIDISRIILEEIREVDTAVRYGGEEFMVILQDTGPGGAAEVAERIRRAVADADFYFHENQPPTSMTVSLGVASCQKGAAGVDLLIKMADAALYAAKERGRNRVETAGQIDFKSGG